MEVLLALPGVVIVMVAVLLAVRGEEKRYMLWDRVGLGVVQWGGDKSWDTSYIAQTHIHHN